MAEKADKTPSSSESDNDEYEILPHKDIIELREELRSLKAKPTEKNLQISMVELSTKLDRLIEIFEEAQEEFKVEEGAGLTWQEKMQPLLERMDKILEQNSEIAAGIVGLSDQLTEAKDAAGLKGGQNSRGASIPNYLEPFEGPPVPAPPSSLSPLGQPFAPPSLLPPLGQSSAAGIPLPPPPRRR